jgi:hypothetical protein
MYYVYHGPHIKVNEKTLDIEVSDFATACCSKT